MRYAEVRDRQWASGNRQWDVGDPDGGDETVPKGEPWAAFADRRGDWGRDLALHIGRMRCGLTLKELGRHAGGMGVQAVAKACGRMGDKLKGDKRLQRQLARVRRVLEGGGKA